MPATEFTTELDTIVHLGAGRCSSFENYKAVGATRIILVEANSTVFAHLQSRFVQYRNVSLVYKAISNDTANGVFRIFNAEDLSSLRQPTELKSLYSGLEEEKEVTVKTEAIDEFILSLGLSDETRNGLVVDTPGIELPLISKLVETNLLSVFKEIIIPTMRTPLYKGVSSAAPITAMMGKQGFTVRESMEDPDWPVLNCRTNLLYLENKALKKELSAAQQQLQIDEEKHRTQITALEEQLNERLFRKSLFDDELEKAESQLSIIKDILVRDEASE